MKGNRKAVQAVEVKLLDFLSNHKLALPAVRNAVVAAVAGEPQSLWNIGPAELTTLCAHIDPDLYVSTFAWNYAVTSLLSKWKGWSVGVNKSAVAIRGWIASERACRETNASLRAYMSGRLSFTDRRFEFLIPRIQRKVQHVLGSFPSNGVRAECRWSSGATARTGRVPLEQKMSAPVAVSRLASRHLSEVLREDYHWLGALIGVVASGPFSPYGVQLFDYVEEDRFLTVPKNAKTDRVIRAAPAGNAFLQQGVGRYIRRRLKRFGVDLDDQSANCRAALTALPDRSCTLDLSSASDSISLELIPLLLPCEWVNLLLDLRTAYTVVKGTRIKLNSFSAMGCAFTFELESLIFWATCSSVLEEMGYGETEIRERLRVYGDDIVAPSRCYDRLVEVLGYLGFRVNRGKSFAAGPFYESCGIHALVGVCVTPPFQKEVASSLPELIRLHNRLARFGERLGAWLDDDSHRCLSEAQQTLRRIAGPMVRGRLPLLPRGSQLDVGFLSDWVNAKECRNRGLLITVVVTTDEDHKSSGDEYAYAYKLRRPSHLYTYASNGARVNRVKGRGWSLRQRWYQPWHDD